MRLLATSDLHVNHRENREALDRLPACPDDWLIVAGDIGPKPEHLTTALEALVPRFGRVIWTPGNHDLWSPRGVSDRTSGEERYRELVAICRSFGVTTPEDDFPEWPDGTGTRIVPMFLLYDYSFRPDDVSRAEALGWARAAGVLAGDERHLRPDPWPSVEAWCDARCGDTERRLGALAPGTPTVLVNHWPLRYDLARPPRVPEFSLWCGTRRTEHWAGRFHARTVISGHLHLRTTLWRDGVRYDEVSLGYPRDWRQDRGIVWYLRDVLPESLPGRDRFVPPHDPFLDRNGRHRSHSMIRHP